MVCEKTRPGIPIISRSARHTLTTDYREPHQAPADDNQAWINRTLKESDPKALGKITSTELYSALTSESLTTMTEGDCRRPLAAFDRAFHLRDTSVTSNPAPERKTKQTIPPLELTVVDNYDRGNLPDSEAESMARGFEPLRQHDENRNK